MMKVLDTHTTVTDQVIEHTVFVAADPNHEEQEEITRDLGQKNFANGYFWGVFTAAVVFCLCIWWRG